MRRIEVRSKAHSKMFTKDCCLKAIFTTNNQDIQDIKLLPFVFNLSYIVRAKRGLRFRLKVCVGYVKNQEFKRSSITQLSWTFENRLNYNSAAIQKQSSKLFLNFWVSDHVIKNSHSVNNLCFTPNFSSILKAFIYFLLVSFFLFSFVLRQLFLLVHSVVFMLPSPNWLFWAHSLAISRKKTIAFLVLCPILLFLAQYTVLSVALMKNPAYGFETAAFRFFAFINVDFLPLNNRAQRFYLPFSHYLHIKKNF